jgi:hypothetical protein
MIVLAELGKAGELIFHNGVFRTDCQLRPMMCRIELTYGDKVTDWGSVAVLSVMT